MRSSQHHWRGLVNAIWQRARRQRRGAIAIIFAILIVPMIGLIGLAVDFGIWSQAHAMLTRAANSSALNAVKVAANAQLKADANFQSEGQTAGQQWFMSQVAAATLPITTTALEVNISSGQSLNATVSYTGTIPSVFGAIFSAARYPLEVTAVASISTSPFLNVELMLDNSSSMEIGANPLTDMQTLLENSPCDPSMVWYSGPNGYTPLPPRTQGQDYGDYQCSASTGSTTATTVGGLACPVLNIFSTTNPKGTYAPVAPFYTPQGPQLCPASSLLQPNAYQGAPCAFACHFDGSMPAGTGADTYALARRLGVQLRFDVLKTATQSIISTMESDNVPTINNLRVGVFTFNTDVTQVYPVSGEAGNDWATASAKVGYPPQSGSLEDTGIQPPVVGWAANNNTMFTLSMQHLSTKYLTAAGDGSSASSPRKVLMIVTDGMEDSFNPDGSDNRVPISTDACQTFKDMGYTIYVVYTTYYPIMHDYYFANLQSFVESSGPNSLSGHLQACASSPDDYVEASDINQLQADLQNFLTAALNAPARFTQ